LAARDPDRIPPGFAELLSLLPSDIPPGRLLGLLLGLLLGRPRRIRRAR
jgi:hypothetical protein